MICAVIRGFAFSPEWGEIAEPALVKPTTPQHALELAQAQLAALGSRRTPARAQVLAILLRSESVLSHAQILEQLMMAGTSVDRVTVYRVLEWLLEHRLAHKVQAEDRGWRFGALGIAESTLCSGPECAHGDLHEAVPGDGRVSSASVAHLRHGHFSCTSCHRMFCLDDPGWSVTPILPEGFSFEAVELTVRGRCAACSTEETQND